MVLTCRPTKYFTGWHCLHVDKYSLSFADSGKSFGELALINEDCVRNATIIADETTDLVVVNRALYNRSLKSFQAKEFEERKYFVESNPLFSNWQPKYKKQMAMSLRKEIITFDSPIIRQGATVDGLCFLLRCVNIKRFICGRGIALFGKNNRWSLKLLKSRKSR